MDKIEQSIIIARPIEEVFAFVTDYRNDPRWRTGIIEFSQEPEGPTRTGTRLREVLRLGGLRLETVSEVIEHEPDCKCTVKSTSGPIPLRNWRSVEPAPGGTKFTYAIAGEARGFYKLAEPVLVGVFRRQLRMELVRLKRILENSEREAARYLQGTAMAERTQDQCPCCGYYTLDGRGENDICPVCYWEDDDPREVFGQFAPERLQGPNSVHLWQARENFLSFGASEEQVRSAVRPPLRNEMPENN